MMKNRSDCSDSNKRLREEIRLRQEMSKLRPGETFNFVDENGETTTLQRGIEDHHRIIIKSELKVSTLGLCLNSSDAEYAVIIQFRFYNHNDLMIEEVNPENFLSKGIKVNVQENQISVRKYSDEKAVMCFDRGCLTHLLKVEDGKYIAIIKHLKVEKDEKIVVKIL